MRQKTKLSKLFTISAIASGLLLAGCGDDGKDGKDGVDGKDGADGNADLPFLKMPSLLRLMRLMAMTLPKPFLLHCLRFQRMHW